MNFAFRLIPMLLLAASPHLAIGAEPSGADLFAEQCAPCHGLDGKGHTPAGRKIGAKDLTQSKLSDGEIEKQIVTGTKDSRGVDRMPSFKAKLKTNEIAAIVAYVKTFRH